MTSPFTLILSISLILIARLFGTDSFLSTDGDIRKSDSLTMENYKYEIEKINIPDADLMTREEIDSIFHEDRFSFIAGTVTYSPDSTFKIFVIVIESCGAYCNPQYYSWTHFNLKAKEKVQRADYEQSDNNFTTISNIYKLPDGKYLIIEESGARPASVLTVSCQGAKLISFSAEAMTIHPIPYRGNNYFGFCQENAVETDKVPYIRYDVNKKQLNYYYGNNYFYSHGVDIDTLRQGRFIYRKGQFLPDKESIIVNNRENPDNK